MLIPFGEKSELPPIVTALDEFVNRPQAATWFAVTEILKKQRNAVNRFRRAAFSLHTTDDNHTNKRDATMTRFASEAEVVEWVESVDENNTQPHEIADELSAAWQVVFGRPLADEDGDTRRDAWSHLCAAVL